MSGQRRAASSGQQIETFAQTGGDVLNAQRGRTRCRKFYGEWQAQSSVTQSLPE